MNLHKLILTNNACYKAGKTITPKGIMVHSTGANNPCLKRYVGPDDGLLGKNQNNNHWNQNTPDGREVCAHGFIGKLNDGTIAAYQTLPWNYRGWHSGGSANDTHIGFEICEDDLADAAYFNAVYKEAVELCAYLCKQYGLTEKNIICHSEGYKLGIASNHGDVMHWFPKHGKSMDTFRSDVEKLLSKPIAPTEQGKLYRVQVGAYSVKANAEAQLAKVKAAGFKDAFIKTE
jgi:N-acetylmuramoyl-L-alanine amidase CwlA